MWFITAKRTYLIILGIYSDGLQFRNFFIFLCTCYLVSSADDQNLTQSPRFWEKEMIVCGKGLNVEFTWREKYRDSCPLFRGSQPWLLFSCAAATNAQTWRRKQDAYGMNERPKTLSPFQVERGDNRQLLHGQLLGALLVRVALVAPGFQQWNSVYKGLDT